MIAVTAAEDVLRLFFLEMDGQDVAASLCLDYDRVRMLYNSGHDPEYRYYSVGLLLHSSAFATLWNAVTGILISCAGTKPTNTGWEAVITGFTASAWATLERREWKVRPLDSGPGTPRGANCLPRLSARFARTRESGRYERPREGVGALHRSTGGRRGYIHPGT